MSNSKKCVVCGETKEVNNTNFFRSKFHDADGYSSTCAACNVEQSIAREAALAAENPNYNPDSIRQQRKAALAALAVKRREQDLLLSCGLHVCSDCGETKDVSEFSKNSKTYTKLNTICKQCDHNRAKQRWSAYKEQETSYE